jgi:hypothetical protein
MNQIDAEHYCAGNYCIDGKCVIKTDGFVSENLFAIPCIGDTGHCVEYRRKWETPAQYKERTGKELRDDAPVFVVTHSGYREWDKKLMTYGEYKEWRIEWPHSSDPRECTVTIDTAEYGCPPADWRPEE